MKKLFLIIIGAGIGIYILLLGNCSRPLEIANNEPPQQVDTLIVIDTVIISEPPETVIVIDTVIQIDTIIIVLPDSDRTQIFCDTLGECHHDIAWQFLNEEGRFRLVFNAVPLHDHPPQTLAIDVDDQRFLWRPVDDPTFTIEPELPHNAMVRITTIPPHAYGHPVHICVTVTAL